MVHISDLALTGQRAGSGAYGIRLGHNYRSLGALRRVRITSFPSWGIYWAADSWIMSFHDVYLVWNGTTRNSGMGIDRAVGTLAGINWYNLTLENNGTVAAGLGGIEIDNPGVQQWAFFGGVWEGNRGAAEARFHDCEGMLLSGVYVESDLAAAGALDGLVFSGVTNATLEGCRITAVQGHAGKGIRFRGTSRGQIGNTWIHPANWPTGISAEDSAVVTLVSNGPDSAPRNTVASGAALLRLTPKRVTLADAPTIGVDAAAGNDFSVRLTGDRTIGPPTNPSIGQRITFRIVQDGRGGRALKWAPVFKHSWSNRGNLADFQSAISFVYRESRWWQDAAQAPWVG
jgi:hypothetical protein